MPVHSLSPGFVELQYTYLGLLHKMRIPVTPAVGWTTSVEPDLVRKSGAVVDMSTAVDELIVLLRPLFQNTTEFTKAEAWFYPGGASDPIWVYTYAIGLLGSNAGTNVQSSQSVVSFRSSIGGIAKLYLLEGVFVANVRNSYPFGAGNITNLTNYMIGATSWWYARDNGSLVVPIWNTSKTNDKIRKIRLNM